MSNPSKSYHDTTVVVDGREFNLFNQSYGLRLECCRVAGWQLWHIWNGNESLIGGEYESDEFKIKMGDKIVFGNTLKNP